MHDLPTPPQLLAAVADFLRQQVGPALAGSAQGASTASHAALAYQTKVAANMLDISRRQALLAPAAEVDEHRRLQALLGQDGDLATLTGLLADRIASGSIGLQTPGLADHLWQTTLHKLAVDQPGYDTYRRHAGGSSKPA